MLQLKVTKGANFVIINLLIDMASYAGWRIQNHTAANNSNVVLCCRLLKNVNHASDTLYGLFPLQDTVQYNVCEWSTLCHSFNVLSATRKKSWLSKMQGLPTQRYPINKNHCSFEGSQVFLLEFLVKAIGRQRQVWRTGGIRMKGENYLRYWI